MKQEHILMIGILNLLKPIGIVLSMQNQMIHSFGQFNRYPYRRFFNLYNVFHFSSSYHSTC